MSKKAAEGIDALVLEVTFGKAAHMKTEDEAEEMAKIMVITLLVLTPRLFGRHVDVPGDCRSSSDQYLFSLHSSTCVFVS